MDTGKNELSPEIIEAIRSVVKEEIGNAILNQHPFFGMLESEKVFMEEKERLHEYPLKSVLGHVTKVTRTEDGRIIGIEGYGLDVHIDMDGLKLNERGREFANNIYKKQRFNRDDIVDPYINTEKE